MSATALAEIQDIAQRIAESEGLELVDVEFKSGRSRALLRILIDKPGGVTLDDCENLSRQMSAILDVKDFVNSAYVLEVSSPGLDRPLTAERDFRRMTGKLLRVHYLDQEDKLRETVGKLIDVDAGGIVLEWNGQSHRIERSRLQRAVQEIVLSQPKKNLKKRKSR